MRATDGASDPPAFRSKLNLHEPPIALQKTGTGCRIRAGLILLKLPELHPAAARMTVYSKFTAGCKCIYVITGKGSGKVGVFPGIGVQPD